MEEDQDHQDKDPQEEALPVTQTLPTTLTLTPMSLQQETFTPWGSYPKCFMATPIKPKPS